MPLSIRARTLLAVVCLVVAGLAASDVATTVALRAFLQDRIDQQLSDVAMPAGAGHDNGGHGGPGGPGGDGGPHYDWTPSPGAFIESFSPTGSLSVSRSTPIAPNDTTLHLPQLPAVPPQPAAGANPVLQTLPSSQAGESAFRVAYYRAGDGDVVIVGQSLHDLEETVSRLVVIEGLVTLLVVLAVLLLGLWLVRAGLRPLDRITRTADAIAGGDLSLRAPGPNQRTEVGRLALAFNTMLERIEVAFAEQRASEERLRRFIADASHELRTPLTSVRGYAELFRRGADRRPEDLARVMRGIESEAARMGLLVDDLLLLARLDQGRPLAVEPVDLSALAEAAVEAARAVEPERPLELVAGKGVEVEGDGVRLRQVVDNLLANVRAHTPAGTPATVRVTRAADGATLAVEDGGPGIPEGARAHIFERFYRADESRSRDREKGGTGLGLAIVSAIVEAHGGQVMVGERPGGGASFTIRLPAPARPSPPAREPVPA